VSFWKTFELAAKLTALNQGLAPLKAGNLYILIAIKKHMSSRKSRGNLAVVAPAMRFTTAGF
jgi:hypothetical protein